MLVNSTVTYCEKRTAFIWAITPRIVVIPYRCFKTTYWCLHHGSRIFWILCPWRWDR